MPIEVTLENGVEAQAFFAKVNEAIRTELPSLFRSLGDVYVADVKRRIVTSDGGSWAPASKWLRAKTGQSKVLLGVEKYIKARISNNKLSIVSTARSFSLSDHDKGFTNAVEGPGEKHDEHGRVVLNIKDGRPLNLYTEMRKRRGVAAPVSQTFAFIARKAGVTPARKIWPTVPEAISLGQPIGFKWLEALVKQAGGNLVR